MRRYLGLAIVVLMVVAGVIWQLRQPAVVRIGIIPFTPVNDRVVEGFKAELAARGFREGATVEYKILPADSRLDQLDAGMAELMALKPSLVLAASTPPAQAAYRATKASATPMVFAPVTDPIDAKIVSNLKHPGEHVTGIRLDPSNGLRLQWLKRVDPRVKTVYLPYTSVDASAQASLKQIEEAARVLGIRLQLKPVLSLEDIQRAAREIPPGVDAIFLPNDSRIEGQIDLFVENALRRRLPLCPPSGIQVEKGALVTYGFNHRNIGEQAGRLAAEILQGTKPGDLPVETAANILILNLRTAQAIGLNIDDAVLRQARQVIR
jgi:putative tryptophan/tyrosine transport system substrate-binding protein